MMKSCVYGALGSCCVLAALIAQPVQAADQGFYFKADAGLALVQDVDVKSIGNAIGSVAFPFAGTLSDPVDVLGVTIPAGTYTVNKPKVSFDPGLRVDLIGGYNVSETVALELEAGLLYNSLDKITISGTQDTVPFSKSFKLNANLWQVPVLVNGVYTFKLDSKFKPFLGAGVGGVWTCVEGSGESESDFTFAYQAMAGVKYELSNTMDIGLTYKFLGSLDHEFGGLKTDGIYSHSILAAFTFRF